MPYPTISQKDAASLFDLNQRLASQPDKTQTDEVRDDRAAYTALYTESEKEQEGGDFCESRADSFFKTTDFYLRARGDADVKAGEMDQLTAIYLHKILNLEPLIAADQDFWRWLVYRDGARGQNFIRKRYAGTEDEQNLQKYCHLGSAQDAYFLRLWRLANSLLDPDTQDPYSTLRASPANVDFYFSGILRPNYGNVNNIARAFVRYVTEKEIPKGDDPQKGKEIGYRRLYRYLTFQSANYCYELMDYDQAYAFMHNAWQTKDDWNRLFKR